MSLCANAKTPHIPLHFVKKRGVKNAVLMAVFVSFKMEENNAYVPLKENIQIAGIIHVMTSFVITNCLDVLLKIQFPNANVFLVVH